MVPKVAETTPLGVLRRALFSPGEGGGGAKNVPVVLSGARVGLNIQQETVYIACLQLIGKSTFGR